MINVNWKNLVENLIIVIVVSVSSMAAGYFFSINAAERMLDNQKPIIVEAIRKETNQITNEFKTEIKKLKVKKDGVVDFDTYPNIDNENSNLKNNDSLPKKKKKEGFFKRLFGNKDKS